MYCEDYKQLSLIAEDDVAGDYCDWSIDTNPSPELARSIERVLDYFHGGQNKNSAIVECPPLPPTRDCAIVECPPLPPTRDCVARGDDGTWIEPERRGDNIYEYLRWREGKTKRSKYLGKVA